MSSLRKPLSLNPVFAVSNERDGKLRLVFDSSAEYRDLSLSGIRNGSRVVEVSRPQTVYFEDPMKLTVSSEF